MVSAADSVGLYNIISDIPSEQNHELIDVFLADDGANKVADAWVKDSQEVLDGMGEPIDLDWMHTVISASDTHEIEVMWQDMLSGRFWGVSEPIPTSFRWGNSD